MLSIDGKIPCLLLYENYLVFIFIKSLISTAVGSGPLRALRRRHEARREIFTTPGLVTAPRSILGPPAEGRPGPSVTKSGIDFAIHLLAKDDIISGDKTLLQC